LRTFLKKFHLTDWNFTEPISYLIALGLETLGLLYFVRKGRSIGFAEIFNNRFISKRQKLLLQRKSTNPEAQLHFLEKRLKLLSNKINYGAAN
jgi:hypothetical protein